MMERRRDERRTNYDRRTNEQLARQDGEREVAALGRSVDLIVHAIGQSLGGWWAEHEVSTAVRQVTFDDDVVYRAHYDFSPTRLADRSYEVVRPAYLIGHIAGANPMYEGLSFESVENDLRTGWSEEIRAKHGDWDAVRHYAKEAFARQRRREFRKSGEQLRLTSEHPAEYENGGSGS
jgi:hypothetical protein